MTTTTEAINLPPVRPNLPDPRPVDLSTFEFKVLTEKTLPTEPGWVYYGITPEAYETMSRNTAELLRWIQEADWRLQYYKGEASDSRTGRTRLKGSGESD